MAGEWSSGFRQHPQGMLFESGGARTGSCSTSASASGQLIPVANFYGNPAGSVKLGGFDAGMIFSQNSLDSGSSLLLDSVPGLKHDTGLAVEWSVDEQYKLEEGLAKYASEPTIMQYIKIAASLRDKTVRDVALRCSWMTRKRRKQEEDHSFSKKVKNQKELAESSLKNSITAASTANFTPHSFPRNQNDPSGCMISEALSGTTRHLLEENNQAFGQISANISSLKLQENVEIFLRTRNNINKILNDMSNTPGMLSRMPPLPVLLNDNLASSIFPHSPKAMPLSSSTPPLILKPEPGY